MTGESEKSLQQEIASEMAQLRRENQVLRAEIGALRGGVIEGLPEILFIKDTDSRFVWGNNALLKGMGFSSLDEIIGKTDHDFFSPEHAASARADEIQVMETGNPIIDKLERDNYRDGSTRYVLTSRMVLRDEHGQVAGTFGWVKDITAMKRAEQALAKESALLNALLQNMPDAVYFKDRESRFVRVSKGIHLEGLKKVEEAYGKTDFDFFTREHAQQAFDDEQEIMRTGNPIVDKIERETYPNKPDTLVSTTKVPIRDSDGVITGLVGISRDVTERLRAEEAVRKARDELEIRVQERTAALVQEIKQHLKTEKALRENEISLQESNRKLETQIRQLDFLNATAQRLSFCTHRRELLPAIVEAFTRLHPGVEVALAERGDEEQFLVTASSPAIGSPTHLAGLATALKSLTQSPPTSPQWHPSRTLDPRLASLPQLEHLPNAAYAEIPLRMEDRTLAIIQVMGGEEFLEWYQSEQVVVETLAAQAAVSLSNANHIRSLEMKARLEGELAVAQRIQQRFTPSLKAPIPRIHLKGVYLPAYEVGGDYLDYFQTDAGHWVIVIADVSGKGIPAALVMTMLRSTFRAEARYENSAKSLMCAVNDLMCADLDDKTFITALCLIIDSEGKSMSYARAGHPPLVLNRASGNKKMDVITPKGLALGLISGEAYDKLIEEVLLPLDPEDRYLVFTDGLVEAMNAERKPYGMPRLMKLLNDADKATPEELVAGILEDVKKHTGNQPSHDDLTMLAMQVMG